ncbi:hypothetical protein Syun_016892 [Stephania yunnanensis]|uniref:Uncharacterized protein n=1 Tax=Stephania yunnanensis TaxID=152371 RepID=A0AAP0P4D8_9MAGN
MTPQQQVLAAQAQGNLGTSPTYGDTDPRRFRVVYPGMKEGELTTKECEDDQRATIREQSSATREQRMTRQQRREGEASARGRPGSLPTREQRRRLGSRGTDQGAEAPTSDQGAEAPTREQRRRLGSRGPRVRRQREEYQGARRLGTKGARVRRRPTDDLGAEARG